VGRNVTRGPAIKTERVQPCSVRHAALAWPQCGQRGLEGYFPNDLPDPAARFGVIAALDVLEHMAAPPPFLAAIRARLAPGGRLFLQVPNWDSLLVRLEGARSSVVCPGHWSYFTPATLPDLLARAGFRTLEVDTVQSEIDRLAAFPPAAVPAQRGAANPTVRRDTTPVARRGHVIDRLALCIGVADIDPPGSVPVRPSANRPL
jgi:SAM-dependent methyltransferase